MHNALAVLLSILSVASLCTARVLPPTPHSKRSFVPQQPLESSLEDKCTFTLWHMQLHLPESPTKSVNYIQINTLVDHANGLTIDIAHLRPSVEFNSYSKISTRQVFTIENLLDERNLTVRGEDGSDVVRFEVGAVGWSTLNAEMGRAWCEVGNWDAEDHVKAGTRERRMECAFPCGKMDEVEEERFELR